jgi:polysaccharide biosynthesis protein PslH
MCAELGLQGATMVPPTWIAKHRRLGQLYSTFTGHSFFQQSVTAPAFQRALDEELRNRFDVVQTEFTHLGPFALRTDALKVLDAHNVEHDNFRRMWKTSPWGLKKLHYGLEYRKMRADEFKTCAAHDVVLATSERDRALLAAHVPGPKHVVPNGVDCQYFSPPPAGTEIEPYSLAFSGSMAYVPNHDGIAWFIDEVMPRIKREVPQVKLYVIGRSPPPHIRKRASMCVHVTGTVPDVRPYVWRAAVFVVPLRMGGGTRLKIAEALAMKKPVVTTQVGSEGIELVNGESALIANDPEAFAQAVMRLLKDRALGARLSVAGHSLIRRKYEWKTISDSLDSLYRERVKVH